jgi:hypothetical protein
MRHRPPASLNKARASVCGRAGRTLGCPQIAARGVSEDLNERSSLEVHRTDLDLRPLFSASGYQGTNPIADGYLRFEADGSGGTKVMFDADGPAAASPWWFQIVTLDHLQPSGIRTGDWLFA